MNLVRSMLLAHPGALSNKVESLSSALESLAQCGQICFSCADACLGENSPEELRGCIRLNLDCAAICGVTATLILRQAETPGAVVHAQLHACAVVCQACADLCATHASHHHHCEICANACRDCQEKCNILLGELSGVWVASTD